MDNIVLDFTQGVRNITENQPKAVMSATLAKKLLKSYADSLSVASPRRIISRHVDTLNACETVEQAVSASIDFIQERELLDNVTNGNWDAYTIEDMAIAV